MTIELTPQMIPLFLFALSWFFFVIACEPKSKYAFMGVASVLLSLAVVTIQHWGSVAETLAAK